MTADVQVIVENRIRLAAALLSLTSWPDLEQERHPHGVHTHAKATRQQLDGLEDHRAVRGIQALLDEGRTLVDIFAYLAQLDWLSVQTGALNPKRTPARDLHDFVKQSQIVMLWEKDGQDWNTAVREASNAVKGKTPSALLTQFFGAFDGELQLHPNLCYPSEQTIAFRRDDQIIGVCPPRVAWGDNPPWPYDDDPVATNQDMFAGFTRVLLKEHLAAHIETLIPLKQRYQLPLPDSFKKNYPDWYKQFSILVTSGMTALYTEQAFGDMQAKAYVLMTKKAHGLTTLPQVLYELRLYQEQASAGQVKIFGDYLPTFLERLQPAVKS